MMITVIIVVITIMIITIVFFFFFFLLLLLLLFLLFLLRGGAAGTGVRRALFCATSDSSRSHRFAFARSPPEFEGPWPGPIHSVVISERGLTLTGQHNISEESEASTRHTHGFRIALVPKRRLERRGDERGLKICALRILTSHAQSQRKTNDQECASKNLAPFCHSSLSCRSRRRSPETSRSRSGPQHAPDRHGAPCRARRMRNTTFVAPVHESMALPAPGS